MKLMRTQDAVGHMLCHDITQIIKDEKKGPVFRKGHIIREEDVPVLLSVGKDHIYIWENNENMLHEDDAAEVLRARSSLSPTSTGCCSSTWSACARSTRSAR